MTASSDAPPRSPFAGASLFAWLVMLLPAILGIALDLSIKTRAFPDGVDPTSDINGLQPFFPARPIIPHVLGFRTTVNHGAVFGVGQGFGILFVVFSFLAMGVILTVFARSRRNQWVLHLALGLIIAGALGNLYDRLSFGVVRDFMIFYTPYFPYIFNIADTLLCIGVPLLMICWITGNSDAPPLSSQAGERAPHGNEG